MAFLNPGERINIAADALALYRDTLTMHWDALALHWDALTLYWDALALQGIAKFNLLRINKMLY